ncbi:MAG: hypothetical protein H7X93_12585 [Sphingomonadaceae bacterium]|nr:hypothetical protein [Sphingomonadaceae bacterium]
MTRYLLLCFALMLGAVLLVAERPAAALQAYDDCPANATQLAQSNQPVRCRCDAAATRRGTVWGDDIYTSDSSICRAALHAGVIDANGGLVTLDPEQGRQGYAGSRRNGVETLRFGAWLRSFRVLRGGDWP